jgi:sulfite exporter TauE/SafE
MCGPIVLILSKNKNNLLFYHGGRLISYLFLGFLTGFFSQTFFARFSQTNIIKLSPLVMGATFIFLAIQVLLKRKLHIHFLERFSRINSFFLQKFKNEKQKAFFIGIGTIFLPCGWLYGYVIGAVTTNSIILSMLIMFSFWLGTLPLLSIAPAIINNILRPFKERFSLFSGVLLLSVGIWLIYISISRF